MFAELIESVLDGGWSAVLAAVLDVTLLGYLLYRLIRALRGTRGVPILLGLCLVTGVYFVAGWLGLSTVHQVIGSLAPYAPVALIILLQAEIRTMLRELALQLVPKGRTAKKRYYEYEDVVFALSQLSANKVGALIVIERESGLRSVTQSGVSLEARLSSDLLVSIFQRSSPLHDGGVIIQNERVAAAACFLPLTTNPELVASLGTRHRAAIGITEESDALALIVSETDGRISVAFGGRITRGVTLDRLRLEMVRRLGPVVSMPQGTTQDVGAEEASWVDAKAEEMSSPDRLQPSEPSGDRDGGARDGAEPDAGDSGAGDPSAPVETAR